MRSELVAWARRRGALFTRAQALTLFASHVVDDALTDGVIARVLPSIYALPHVADDRRLLRRAALLHRPDAALAGLDALDAWAILDGEHAHGPVVMVTDERHRESSVTELRVMRRTGFRNRPPDALVRNGMRITRLDTTIVDSWCVLPAIDRRAPALVAVRERRTAGSRLLETLAARGRVAGAAEMRHVFGLLAAGCHSALELWGHEKVFTVGELRRAQCQVRVETPNGVVYLDRFYPDEMLAVEMDGAAFHGAPGQRERDIRRDAAVAVCGIQTVRFSHSRLFDDAARVRAETVGILAVRRRQLGRLSA